MGSNPSKKTGTNSNGVKEPKPSIMSGDTKGTELKPSVMSGDTKGTEPEHKSSPVHQNGKTKHDHDPPVTKSTSNMAEIRSTVSMKPSSVSVDFPFVKGKGNSKWPIHCYAPLDYNVNARHGGCAGLVLLSNAYGGKGSETTNEVFLFRSGFDGNFMQCQSLVRSHDGHFGPSNAFFTDEDGRLIPSCLFGSNHVAFLCNNPKYGNLSHGIFIKGPEDGSTSVTLPLNVNGARAEHGAGCTLVLCGGWEAGVNEARYITALYMIRSGYKDNVLQKSLISGEDKWEFTATDTGNLQAQGPARSTYGLFHNRENLDFSSGKGDGRAGTWHRQAPDGKTAVSLLDGIPESNLCGFFVVLCSHSSGNEDQTCAALYLLQAADGQVESHLQHGLVGKSYLHKSADLWSFVLSGGELLCTGPAGPCRYAVLSNKQQPPKSNPCLFGCLATGNPDPIKGVVTITDKEVIGWVSQSKDIVIKLNEKSVHSVERSALRAADGQYTFHHTWRDHDKEVGLYLARVFCLNHNQAGELVEVELEGSPQQLIYQPSGVIYALNSCGPAYQATSDIVYTSEFTQFANFSYDYVYGTRSKALGGMKTSASNAQILTATLDGALHVTCRSSGVEAEDEQHITYDVPGLPNGNFTLRLHAVSSGPAQSIRVNGTNVTDQMAAQLRLQKEVHAGYTAHSVDLPVTIKDHTLALHIDGYMLCGFVVLDKSYREKPKTTEQLDREREEKSKLTDKVEPLFRKLTRKERKIVGWSVNLLSNATGEAGDMSHWNIAGDWRVTEGGHGTESAFVTSHMKCVKYQEVDLTEHFSEEYLDSAPEIQVSEWYKEGSCGGGFYSFKATIITEDGNVLDSYDSGDIGTLYRDQKWTEEKAVFKSYKRGVRKVTLESSGKDDKFWGGHYGPMISSAVVRVKNPVDSPDTDVYQDIISEEALDGESSENMTKRDNLVAAVLETNQELLELGVTEDDSVAHTMPKADHSPPKQPQTKTRHVRQKRKKREVRVFVSSTFRDFKEEREQLIKKTFREINALCADRGVFFTYVDLRWGITEEQTNHGQTISICLQEISRCRPYFICMMGDRFGWSQQEGQADKLLNESYDYAIRNFPKELGWVENQRYGSSVTELEILHGVLNDVENCHQRSFFYLRDSVKPGEVEDSMLKVFQPESDWHKERQTALKDRVMSAGDLKIKQYRKAETVCEYIKKDLEWCIDEDFPRGTELTALQQEREAHVAFADARRRVYIGRQQYFEDINDYMQKDNKHPLVILGESGSGKSALVANWVGQLEERESDAFIFFHFIGSSAQSVSYIKLIRRLFEELKDFFHLDPPVPTSDSHLVRDLGTWLKMAASRGTCYIILDAMNQLNDGSGTEGSEHDLQWIPTTLPSGVKMLMSTLPGRALEAVRSQSWRVLSVEPLQTDEKMQIITGYLEGTYGKTLSEDQKAMIVNAGQTNNPLYLKALLDEVRIYGAFRTLTQKIAEYLLADNPRHLFAKILSRLEEDFERGQHLRPNLVRDTTTAIWCSNRGMSEAELLDILQVPSAIWSPFYLSLIENLVNRNGIVNFFHDHLRHAVETKYLETAEDKQKGYLWLAEYFDTKDMDDRKCDELPMLLAKSGSLDRLRTTLSDLELFRRLSLSEEGKFDLIKFWNMLGDYSDIEVAYMGALERVPEKDRHTQKYRQIQQALSEFFTDLGLFTPARVLGESLLSNLEEEYRESDGAVLYSPYDQSHKYRCQHPRVIEMLTSLGTICQKQKSLDEAETFYREATTRLDKATTPTKKLQLTEALLGWATVLFYKNNMTEANKYLIRARELATDVLGKRHHYVAAIINSLGQQSYKQGRIQEALAYFVQDLSLTRGEVGTGHPRVAGILNEIALVYDDKLEATAGELFEAALIVLLNTYGNNHLEVAVVRYNLGVFYMAGNLFRRARYQLEQAVHIYTAFLGEEHSDTKDAITTLEDVMSFL